MELLLDYVRAVRTSAKKIKNHRFVLRCAKVGDSSWLGEECASDAFFKFRFIEVASSAVIEGAGDTNGVTILGMGVPLTGRARGHFTA